MVSESGEGDLPPKLPDSGVLTSWAARELGKLTPVAAQATLLETFGRRCTDDHRDREDEPLPVGKNQMLRSIRASYGKDQYRLIYFQVRPVKGPSERGGRVERIAVSVDSRPLRFVGLLSWQKKRTKVGPKGIVAWARSELWLRSNPAYERI
jgi:hypothetical protein